MAELIFFAFLLAPIGIGWWLFAAKRRADALMRDQVEPEEPGHSSFAYEEVTTGADGLAYGRSYAGDDAFAPPEDRTGVVDGIRAMEGRR